METKIAKLKLMSIFEATAVPEGEVAMVSTGASLSIRKDTGTSALFLESSAASARYNKIENEELELPVLQNELAGLVGDFDNAVHKLFTKYGYQWVGEKGEETAAAPVEASEAVVHRVNEAKAPAYLKITDEGDGSLIDVVGPFEDEKTADQWFKDNAEALEGLTYECLTPSTPDDFLNSYSA